MSRNKDPQESAWKKLYRIYCSSAKKKNIDFNLTFLELKCLCLQDCFYCAKPPHTSLNRYLKKDGSYNAKNIRVSLEYAQQNTIYYNGLDRYNNDAPYSLTTVMPCCKVCNYLKSSLDLDEFTAYLRNNPTQTILKLSKATSIAGLSKQELEDHIELLKKKLGIKQEFPKFLEKQYVSV